MKRNRKAEAAKKQRQLTRQEAELRRISALLTEMEAASAEVLAEHFEFTPEQVEQFLNLLRARYRAIQAGLPVFSQDKRLGVLAQKFGLAGLQILVEAFHFTAEQADSWLKGLIEVGRKNRQKGKAGDIS